MQSSMEIVKANKFLEVILKFWSFELFIEKRRLERKRAEPISEAGDFTCCDLCFSFSMKGEGLRRPRQVQN